MSELRGELASGYLEFLSYYKKATAVLKKMVKQDKKWFFLFIFLNVSCAIFSITLSREL